MTEEIIPYCSCNPPVLSGMSAIGQTDFLIIEGQVIDSSGKPLQAVWFYIDQDSKPISDEFHTEPDGKFIVYVPDTIDPNTWVNFASTNDYQPVVKSIAELQASGTVQLNKVGVVSGSSMLIPIVAGAALLLLVIPKKKGSVSGFDPVKRYHGLDPSTKKLILYAGVGVGGFLLIKYLLGYKPTPEQAAELDAASKQLQQMAQVGILPTLTTSQFTSMVASIVKAVDDCGTDEATIYQQFMKLNNEADMYKLIVTYGVQGYKGCFEGSYFGNVHNTLSQTIYGDLNSSNISQVNTILSSKGIPYSF